MLAALNLRSSRRNRGDVTVDSQTMLNTTAFASPEVLTLFQAAKDLDVRWLNAQTAAQRIRPAVPSPPENVELRAARDALTAAENRVIERIQSEPSGRRGGRESGTRPDGGDSPGAAKS